ncbi:hypothetical protein ANANG_G00184400 [Anguilla anguilla]|uniref:Histone-lysine N-methyltransferase EHMT2 n=1 Tax=Anguilla anguilla TaxID=7936 RepID=A0A9D3M7L1_ANGAN|nr:hypothetical protein ANANG_G00184400 [Anguilla anguilla]
MSTSELAAEAAVEGQGPTEGKGEEAESDVKRDTNQSDAGELCDATVTVSKETEPMGGVLSLVKEAAKGGEDGGKSGAAGPAASKGLSGHAAKTLPASSSTTSSSSSSSTSRAKMSVSGPGSKPLPSSSSTTSSSTPPPTAAPPQPKIHRARKTMNRPPPTQVRCLESPIVPVQPTESFTCPPSESSAAAAKRRKVGSDLDSTAPPAGKAENCTVADKEPVAETPRAEGAGPVAKRRSDWAEDWEEDMGEEEFRLFYNDYTADERGDSDSKSGDGGMEERASEGEGESGNISDRSSGSDPQMRGGAKEKGRSESPWIPPGRRMRRRERGREAETEPEGGVSETVAVEGGSSEYTEVPLGSLDIAAADSLTLSPQRADSEGGEMERLEELPLCSCRMEAPRVDGLSGPGNRLCMATESINGELVGCTNTIVKGETMRPSSRVSLMVLCESHRSHMVKHHCCPGCGYFCITGTFLECCPDLRIAHRFHRGCVSVLGAAAGGTGAGHGRRPPLLPPLWGGRLRGPGGHRADCLHGDRGHGLRLHHHPFPPPPLPSSLSLPPSGHPAGEEGCGTQQGGADGSGAAGAAGSGFRRVEDVAPPGEGGVDSVGPSLCLPNGRPVCPSALPPGPSRAALQKAILIQDTERRKKLRFHPRQLYPAQPNKGGPPRSSLLRLSPAFYMLLEGIDPAYQSDSQNRRCALHAAAQRGLLEVCYLLIQAGAKVDAQDKTLRTPLLEAIVNNHMEVVRYLIQSGACVYHAEEDGSTGLHHAAKLGNLEIVTLLLGTGQVDINAQDSGGWTPIIWAAEHRHITVIRALLNRGADVTLKDKEMNVCLHWASFAGSVEIAELVLNAGCPLSSVNMHGDTPLHIASREGYQDCVTLFLSRGADIDIMNREGDTPLSLARCDSPVWVSLQINRKLRRGIANRVVRTERIICSDVAQGYENVPIPCVNGVDEEGCPSDYKYISENCETSTMNIDRNITHLQHCSCTDDCSSSNCLCGQLSIRCWYDKDRRLLQEFNKIEPPLIFECNLACSCFRTCKNRVVQAGIKYVRLQLYRTEKMGWGVRALQDIPQGSFICEYVGELISDAEADVREDDSYLFDLDNKDGEVYCIDARYYGNISRFINHLCDPNIIPVRVFMLHQDLRFPRIAFFSSRDILMGQELGFDYGDRFWDIKSKYFTCQCGSEKCKHSAEAIALEQSRLARLEACPESVPDPGLAMLGNS